MKFVSTRTTENPVDFFHVVLNSYAPDGGLFMPEEIPKLTFEEIQEISKMSYPAIVAKVLRYFIDEQEIPETDLQDMVHESYSKFSIPEVARIKELPGKLNIAEFFHGPTWTFKDMSMLMCARVVAYILKKRNEKAIVLMTTSGDTGSSSIEAFKDIDCVDMVVIYPAHACTEIQIRKMNTVVKNNVHCYAADGNSDEVDVPAKKIFVDKMFAEEYNVISLNSINLLRVMIQSCLYFYIYGQTVKESDDQLEVIVPVGAAGSISGGVIATKMGLPLKLVGATSSNDIVHRAFTKGDLSLTDKVLKTLSPAMDIQVPYNIERVLYLLTDVKLEVKTVMEKFYETGKSQISSELLEKVQNLIVTYCVTDEMKKEAMKRCYDESGYVLCPHTATAVSYHYYLHDNKLNGSKKYVCVATASSKRFPEATLASGIQLENDPDIDELLKLPTKFETLVTGQDWEKIIRNKIMALRSDSEVRLDLAS